MRSLSKLPLVVFAVLFLHLAHRNEASTAIDGAALTAKGKVLVAKNGDFSKEMSGLPDGFIAEKFYRYDGDMYLATRRSGLFRYNGSRWENISGNLFKRRTVISSIDEYRIITAVSYNAKTNTLYAADQHTVYRSADKGEHWTALEIKGYKESNYITALCVDDGGRLLIGTTYDGIYMYDGKNAVKSVKGLPAEPNSPDRAFIETVAFVKCGASGTLYAGFHFGKGLYRSTDKGKSWSKIEFALFDKIYNTVNDAAEYNGNLVISLSGALLTYSPKDKTVFADSTVVSLHKTLADEDASCALMTMGHDSIFVKRENLTAHKNVRAEVLGKRALYTSIYSIKRNTDAFIKTLKDAGYNACVIDVKDDEGDMHAPFGNETAREIHAIKKTYDYKGILQKLKENKIYTIARIVCFKDRRLYEAYENKYAILDSRTGKAWKGNPKEFWLDPYSDFVRNYLVDIAVETESLGFDEIQFDYIRFPADGAIANCRYRYKKDAGTYRQEVLADFLVQAKSRIKVPVSVDIYGFNGYYHFGNIIGQDIELFARYADAISPMVYPSHYGTHFFRNIPAADRPYEIVYHTVLRTDYNGAYQTILRPYIQGFKMRAPTWGVDYINRQIDAVHKAGFDGYIFWNASADYQMVVKAARARNGK